VNSNKTEFAAPPGLENFWFWFLQRCRAYGAGKIIVAAVFFLRTENFTQKHKVANKFMHPALCISNDFTLKRELFQTTIARLRI